MAGRRGPLTAERRGAEGPGRQLGYENCVTPRRQEALGLAEDGDRGCHRLVSPPSSRPPKAAFVKRDQTHPPPLQSRLSPSVSAGRSLRKAQGPGVWPHRSQAVNCDSQASVQRPLRRVPHPHAVSSCLTGHRPQASRGHGHGRGPGLGSAGHRRQCDAAVLAPRSRLRKCPTPTKQAPQRAEVQETNSQRQTPTSLLFALVDICNRVENFVFYIK